MPTIGLPGAIAGAIVGAMDAELDLPDLPPRLPPTVAELDAARALLGEAARTALRPASAARLERLVGEVPDQVTARLWKRSLGVYRQELRGELGSGHDQVAEPQRLSRAS